MHFCQLTSSGSLIRHRKPQKNPDGSWPTGMFQRVNLCAGGWPGENETTLIPRHRASGGLR